MFKIIDPQGNLVAVVSRIIVSSTSNQYIDNFVDNNGNLYFERDHSDVIDAGQLSPILVTKAQAFYQIQGLKLQTSC
jgi:hypothetical protein